MGEKNGSSALTRIEQFKDNETERLAEGLLVANTVVQVSSENYALTNAHFALLSAATALPLAIGSWHRRNGWMNQPTYHWPP